MLEEATGSPARASVEDGSQGSPLNSSPLLPTWHPFKCAGASDLSVGGDYLTPSLGSGSCEKMCGPTSDSQALRDEPQSRSWKGLCGVCAAPRPAVSRPGSWEVAQTGDFWGARAGW